MTSSKGGRPSPWISSSKTRLIRVPDHMADEILKIAKAKDKGENISIIQNLDDSIVQNSSRDMRLEKATQLIDSYKLKSHPTSERWKLLNKFISELEAELD